MEQLRGLETSQSKDTSTNDDLIMIFTAEAYPEHCHTSEVQLLKAVNYFREKLHFT